eukprot:scaffold22653_cov119-Cylindrotheca_fusiformis.AAC.14
MSSLCIISPLHDCIISTSDIISRIDKLTSQCIRMNTPLHHFLKEIINDRECTIVVDNANTRTPPFRGKQKLAKSNSTGSDRWNPGTGEGDRHSPIQIPKPSASPEVRLSTRKSHRDSMRKGPAIILYSP